MENALRTHIGALCQGSRAPDTLGYFKAQEYLKNFIRGIGLSPQEHHFSVWGRKKCTNIYAESHPGEDTPVTLIGAHYETRDCSGVGADDNASAVAVALETAKTMLEKNTKPFVLILFDMEEIYKFIWQDLQGSKAFAKFYKRPIERVVILDLVGGALAPHFENIFMQFGNALSQLKSDTCQFLHLPMVVVEPVGRLGPRSDYHAFRNRNIPFTFFSSGTPWYYHTQYDTPDILNYSKMATLAKSLSDSLLGFDKNIEEDVHLESFLTFMKTFMKTEELKHPLIEKLLRESRLPSRFEMVRLYRHILPTIRKHGQSLW